MSPNSNKNKEIWYYNSFLENEINIPFKINNLVILIK